MIEKREGKKIIRKKRKIDKKGGNGKEGTE